MFAYFSLAHTVHTHPLRATGTYNVAKHLEELGALIFYCMWILHEVKLEINPLLLVSKMDFTGAVFDIHHHISVVNPALFSVENAFHSHDGKWFECLSLCLCSHVHRGAPWRDCAARTGCGDGLLFQRGRDALLLTGDPVVVHQEPSGLDGQAALDDQRGWFSLETFETRFVNDCDWK